MLSVLIAAACTTLLATFYGFPISATHSIVGGLIAVGMAAKGTDSIGWANLGATSIGWVLSPMVGGLTSAIFYVALEKTVIETADPVRSAARMQPVFTAVTLAICLLFMFLKGPKGMQIEHDESGYGPAVGLAVASGTGLSVLAKLYGTFMSKGAADDDAGGGEGNDSSVRASKKQDTSSSDRPAAEGTELTTSANPVGGDDEESQNQTASSGNGGPPSPLHAGGKTASVEFVHVLSYDSEPRGESDEEENADYDPFEQVMTAEEKRRAKILDRAEKPFVNLLILSAFTVAFAHGGNDVGNAVGPLCAILSVYQDGEVVETPHIPLWALCVGGAGFCFGIVLLGKNTISTVGSKITKLTPSKSYATQIGAAVAVLLSSAMGLPVSTSHCLVGSVIGIGICQKCMKPEESSLNLAVLKKIVLGWAVTIPLAMGVAVCIFLPLRPVFE